MVWPPVPSVAVLKVATPPFSGSGIAVPPSTEKFTAPVGVPPGPDTVAVKVTDWPSPLGFCDDVNVMVVLALSTCCTAKLLLPLKLTSPP